MSFSHSVAPGVELCITSHVRPKHSLLFYPQNVRVKVFKDQIDYYLGSFNNFLILFPKTIMLTQYMLFENSSDMLVEF